MSKSDEQAKREKEAEKMRREHLAPSGRGIHNALIDVRVQAYREAGDFLQTRIPELEAEKLDENKK